MIRRFGIGAAPPSAQVGHRLMEEGFTEEELVQAGLMLRREGRTFDMFRNRAMFPIIDTYGNVLGFGGRAMGDAMPKYLNTSDTPAFNKRYTVFAANLLRKARGLTRVILVEGYMDVVALSQIWGGRRGGHAGHGADPRTGEASASLCAGGVHRLRR